MASQKNCINRFKIPRDCYRDWYFCNANNLNRDWKRTPLNIDFFSINKFARCEMFIVIVIMDLKIDRLPSSIYKQHIKNPTMNPKFPFPINGSNCFF